MREMPHGICKASLDLEVTLETLALWLMNGSSLVNWAANNRLQIHAMIDPL